MQEKQQISRLRFQFYSGPNIHATKSVVQLNLRVGRWLDIDAKEIPPGYKEALSQYFPILEGDRDLEHCFANGGNIIGQTLRSVTKALLHLLGFKTQLVGALSDDGVDEYKFFFAYDLQHTAFLVIQLASRVMRDLANRFIDPAYSKPFKLALRDECITFLEEAKKTGLGNSQRPLVEIAEERDIPWQKTSENFLLFGQGKYQRKIQHGFTDRTSFFGVQVSTDKKLTSRILREANLPVPMQVVVKSSHAAVKGAQAIGYPVVVKPLNADFGNGVSVKLESETTVISAFDLALKYSNAVIVEKYIPGEDHRLLVIDGEVTSVAKRIPAHIVGDGRQTIGQLVDQENRRRVDEYFLPWALQPLKLDEGAIQHLRNNRMSEATVPESGQQVFLRYNANLATGGSMMDITELAHPSVKEMACLAADAIGLDVAGIDYLTPDISRPHSEVGGGMCEVNCTPGYNYHNRPPGVRDYRHVTVPYMNYLIPEGSTGRVSTISILANDNGTDAIVEAILSAGGYAPGRASAEGCFFSGRPVRTRNNRRLSNIHNLFKAKRIDSAIVTCNRESLRTEGLGFDSSNVCALQGEGETPPDHGDIISSDQVLIANARDAIVLTSDNPNYDPGMFANNGKKIYLIGLASDKTTIDASIADNVTIVTFDGDNSVTCQTNRASTKIMENFTATDFKDPIARENILFAIAITLAFGLNDEVIDEGLRNFFAE